MTDLQVKTFIDVTLTYFEKTTSDLAEIESPFIQFDRHRFNDFTGWIQVSGQVEGSVMITASREMLESLIKAWIKVETRPEDLKDLIGEVANTIASNVRRDFGSSFHVSVPIVFTTATEPAAGIPEVTLVLPIRWREFSCELVVGLKEGLSA
jgi:chemotaxis protein CheX